MVTLGLIFSASSTFLNEIASSISKLEARKRLASIYALGFLNLMTGTLGMLIIGITRLNGFYFSTASLPTFLVRLVLEIAQAHMTMLAITQTERSAYGFIRVGTLPLLLLADVALGYPITLNQSLGITTIVLSILLLLANHGIRTKGLGYVIFTTINAAITLSLYKYDITHFNSVAAEQSIVMGTLMLYFAVASILIAKQNPLKLLARPLLATVSLSAGIGDIIGSFAYVFAPASIITTAKRSFELLWSMLSGTAYFHEKHILLKLSLSAVIIAGLMLITI